MQLKAETQDSAPARSKDGIKEWLWFGIFVLAVVYKLFLPPDKISLGVFVVINVIALVASALLFHFAPFTAKFEGPILRGSLKLGGAVVLYFLILLFGISMVKDQSETVSLTVFVHGPNGGNDIVLKNSGLVSITIGTERRSAGIGDKGQAEFKQIPQKYFGEELPIWVDSATYECLTPNKKYKLTDNPVYVEVRRKLAHIRGRVLDDERNPIAGAVVGNSTFTCTTANDGSFEIEVPSEIDEQELGISAVGFDPTNSVASVGQRPEIMLRRANRGFDVALPKNISPNSVAISPDGSSVILAGTKPNGVSTLWLVRDGSPAEEIEGTEGGIYPFWSPDGRRIGFFQKCYLKTMEVTSGVSVEICPAAPAPRGGAWVSEHQIVFSKGMGTLILVDLKTLETEAATTLQTGDTYHAFPSPVPGSKQFLYTAFRSTTPREELRLTKIGKLRDEPILSGAWNATLAPNLLVVGGSTLTARKYSMEKGEIDGPLINLPFRVGNYLGTESFFSTSTNGLIAYHSGHYPKYETSYLTIGGSWKDVPSELSYRFGRFSPSGSSFIVQTRRSFDRERVLIEVSTKDNIGDTIFTAPDAATPVFGENGELYYVSQLTNVYLKENIGSRSYGRLVYSHTNDIQALYPPRGSGYLPFVEYSDVTQADILAINLRGESGDTMKVCGEKFWESNPSLSSGGEWLAYSSNENRCNSEFDVYVQRFPIGSERIMIPDAARPEWEPSWKSGGYLYFLTERGTRLARIKINTTPSLHRDGPIEKLESITEWAPFNPLDVHFTIAPSGQQILVHRPATISGENKLSVRALSIGLN